MRKNDVLEVSDLSCRFALAGIATHHRFLWPKNALGRPVRIRMAPRTPKPGSILVSRCEGSAEAVAEAAALVAFAVLDGDETKSHESNSASLVARRGKTFSV